MNSKLYAFMLITILIGSALTAMTSSISQPTIASTTANCDNGLAIISTEASGQTGSNGPDRAIDGKRWSYWYHDAQNSWISANLGAGDKVVCSVTIDWYQVGSNENNFDIYTSLDGITYTKVAGPFFDADVDGPETYDIPDTNANFVKVQMTADSSDPKMREIGVIGKEVNTNPDPSNELFLIAKMRIHVDDQQMLVDLYKPHMKVGDIAFSHPNEENLDFTKQLTPSEPGVQYFSTEEIENNVAVLKAEGVKIISLDLEPEYSPAEDVVNPPQTVEEICQVIHANGMKCMASPSRALTTQYGVQLAPFLDVYNIQAQALQDNGCQTEYKSYVVDMVKKLKAANPDLLVTSQVSTSRGTLDNMKECFAAVADVVDGANNFYSNDQEGFDKLGGFVSWFDETYRNGTQPEPEPCGCANQTNKSR